MTSRKGLVGHSPNAARSTVSPLLSKEYLEAVKTLDDATIKQACEWALVDEDGVDQEEKLLECFHKCESAFKIIQKQQLSSVPNSPMPPGPPNLSQLGSGRSQVHRGALPKLSSLGSTNSLSNGANSSNMKKIMSKGGVIPIRRTAMKNPRMLANMADSSEGPSSKKSRLDISNGSNSSGGSNGSNPQAPPPAALNFLAKLNKDNGSGGASNNSPSSSLPKRRAQPRRSSN